MLLLDTDLTVVYFALKRLVVAYTSSNFVRIISHIFVLSVYLNSNGLSCFRNFDTFSLLIVVLVSENFEFVVQA